MRRVPLFARRNGFVRHSGLLEDAFEVAFGDHPLALHLGALLGELRRLAETYPDDATVRERLAKGLAFAAVWSNERGDDREEAARFAELRDLLDRYADDDRLAPIRAWLKDLPPE